MRSRSVLLLVAGSLLRVGCASTPAPAPRPQTDVPPASPAVAAEKLGGLWLFTVLRGGQSIDQSLHISLTAGELVGSLTGPDGNAREISKIALRGDKVSWEIAGSGDGQGPTQKFEGTLKSASSMEGTIQMTRGSRGGQRRGGGSSGGSSGGQSGDDGGSTAPPDDGQPASGGGGGGYGGRGGGRGGRGGRRGGGGSASKVTWKAFKTVEPAPETTPAPAKPAGN
jgi:hypothetical protein